MADVKLNFSSQWPSVQVAKVVYYPNSSGETAAYPYGKKHKHGLGYPPLAIAMSVNGGLSSYETMKGVDVDEQYVYMDTVTPGRADIECVVVYAIDISQAFNYSKFESQTGDVLEDTSGGVLDLRKFLMHSRAVSPMVLDIVTKNFVTGDLNLVYNSPLSYPTFSFGYIHTPPTSQMLAKNVWISVPLQGQAYPVMPTNGYRSEVYALNAADQDKGSIVILRNPAVITNNTVNVTL